VIHNASILNACGASGLQLYNFGQTVSLVFFTETWRPSSFYDRIKENWAMGLHTLVLVDIKVREQSEANMARCVRLPPSPRTSFAEEQRAVRARRGLVCASTSERRRKIDDG
jgi:diphthine synthase